jgi:1-hydroxycarotenoid 3,4-desaturase
LRGIGDLWRISPFATLWSALGTHFHDPRLRQLFGRYATYCGSSPFEAPATLMLVAHVEREGVWLVQGGMHRLAAALADLAVRHGAAIRYATPAADIGVDGGRAARVRLASGEDLAADAVVVNADPAALTRGLFGRDAAAAVGAQRVSRSLSAVTWALLAKTDGFPLVRHNVFFSGDYKAEFDDIFRAKRLPAGPTVYVCAQDRDDEGVSPQEADRLLVLVNAPPTGDSHVFGNAEIEQCRERAFALLRRCGANIQAQQEMTVATTPNHFDGLYPGSGGGLYGQASHGWTASFSRPTARTRIPGLYLAGGCTHPGPGVPMAAISGRLAAEQVFAGLASRRPSRKAATPGGTSTPSATTASTR